jgi:folate-binding Fe-S cluster repair protein YgfZ
MTVDSQQYAALTTGVGFAELRDWTQIELTGADRWKFLNNFCTADLSKLAPMRGAEAFICNVKGKVLGHVFILNDYDRLFLVTVPGQAQTLIPHLDRYTLRDDVALRDVSGEARLIQLAGNSAASLAEQTLATHVNERRLDQQLPRHWLESCECLLHREIPSLIARGLIGPESFLYRTGEFIVMQHIEYLR